MKRPTVRELRRLNTRVSYLEGEIKRMLEEHEKTIAWWKRAHTSAIASANARAEMVIELVDITKNHYGYKIT